ncbi:MAG: hypothetical protein WBE65_12045 [Steroidobacteraceae bacterium]
MVPGLVSGRRHRLLALTAGRSRSGVRGDALIPHHLGEILAPLSQHGFVDVEAPTVDALGLNDQVHVWVLLVSMECHGVAVLRPELLACKHLRDRLMAGLTNEELEQLLDAGAEIEAYCVSCDEHWVVATEDRADMARALELLKKRR